MGKFSGYLICSDMDRTLCIGTDICKKNINAIRYFQQNGGLFTVSTGRNYQYVRDNFADKFICNTYMITLNGTFIINPENCEIIRDVKLSADTCGDIIHCARRHIDKIMRINLCTHEAMERLEYGEAAFEENIYPANKVVVVTYDTDGAKEIRADLEKIRGGRFDLNQSWDTGLEMIPSGSGKGACVAEIKNLLGDRAKITIAVGDYENDLSMLSVADVAYAVEDADEQLIKAADRLTCTCMDGSIAGIIDDIEKGVI